MYMELTPADPGGGSGSGTGGVPNGGLPPGVSGNHPHCMDLALGLVDPETTSAPKLHIPEQSDHDSSRGRK